MDADRPGTVASVSTLWLRIHRLSTHGNDQGSDGDALCVFGSQVKDTQG
jgi:hypothetical protein